MMDTEQAKPVDEQYVLKQYKDKIDYYWSASRSNKNAYKRYRTWSIILGALVTFVSSISAAEFVQSLPWLRITFAVATPIIAATLTVIGGLGQNFHWGATWRDMVVNATRLEKERDRFMATSPEKKDIKDEFLKKGVQLSIDGLEPEEIRDILDTEIDYIRNRHQLGAEIFTTMGTFAPAMGMIGTLIGLVQMLQRMDDPSTIGPAMALALLTTFYGSIMANICCMPVAGKLKTRSKEEMLVKEMIVQGIISLSNGDNHRIVEQKLMAFIPPNKIRSGFKTFSRA